MTRGFRTLLARAPALVLLSALAAHAEEEVDLRTQGTELHKRLIAFESEPRQEGWDGRELHAWKAALKRRAPRMERRVRGLLDTEWVTDDEGRAVALLDKDWPKAVRALVGIQPELHAAEEAYSDVKVSEDRAYKLWDRKYPVPESIRDTPSYPALTQARSDIRYYELQNQVVPGTLIARERALALQCEQELDAMIAQWERDKEAAYAEIKAAADSTRNVLSTMQARLQDTSELAKDWMASLQEAEEQILQTKVEALDGDARTEAAKILEELGDARRKAQDRQHRSPTVYGRIVRQDWIGPRKKLLALLSREAKAKAAAAGADEGDTGDSTSDK